MPDLTKYQMKSMKPMKPREQMNQLRGSGRPVMRALIAAATGLAVALALVLALTAMGSPAGETSPKPLLTTVPAHP